MLPHQASAGLKPGISCMLGSALLTGPHPQHLERIQGSSVGVAVSGNRRLGRKETSEMGLRLAERESSAKALGLRPGGAWEAREESTWVKDLSVRGIEGHGRPGDCVPAKEWEAPRRTCDQNRSGPISQSCF